MKVPEHVHADEEPCECAAHVRRVRDCVVTVPSAAAAGVPVVDGQGDVEGGDEERQGAAMRKSFLKQPISRRLRVEAIPRLYPKRMDHANRWRTVVM